MFIYEARRDNHNGTNTRKAREIATRVLGKSLPDSVEIHHVDGDPGNNQHSNLVICEDCSYHQTLHARTEAFLACGNTNWKRCWICKEYCDENDLIPSGTRGFQHLECGRQYHRDRPIQTFCCFCKEPDSPENLQVNKANGQAYHKACAAQYRQIQREDKAIRNLFNTLTTVKGGD